MDGGRSDGQVVRMNLESIFLAVAMTMVWAAELVQTEWALKEGMVRFPCPLIKLVRHQATKDQCCSSKI